MQNYDTKDGHAYEHYNRHGQAISKSLYIFIRVTEQGYPERVHAIKISRERPERRQIIFRVG